MRRFQFRIAHFLLYVPCVFFSTFGALLLLNNASRVHPRCTAALNDVVSLRELLVCAEDEFGAPADSDEVNSWLLGQPSVLTLVIGVPPPIDPWGRNYRSVKHCNTTNGEAQYHFFSLGEDGASQSGGNDRDDINSWSATSGEFYVRRQMRKKIRVSVEIACVLGAGFVAIIGLASRTVKSLRVKSGVRSKNSSDA
jgi:hypothetical protein